MSYTDSESNEKYIPYIIESTIGVDRAVLAVLSDAYQEEILENNEKRIVLKINPYIAPYKVAILPLTKNQTEEAKTIYKALSLEFMCLFDESGSIGKRYRRQDEIGTPYCITVDYDTLEDKKVTIRDRDTMQQERINVSDIKDVILKRIKKFEV